MIIVHKMLQAHIHDTRVLPGVSVEVPLLFCL